MLALCGFVGDLRWPIAQVEVDWAVEVMVVAVGGLLDVL
jgi:hypothetical protein